MKTVLDSLPDAVIVFDKNEEKKQVEKAEFETAKKLGSTMELD